MKKVAIAIRMGTRIDTRTAVLELITLDTRTVPLTPEMITLGYMLHAWWLNATWCAVAAIAVACVRAVPVGKMGDTVLRYSAERYLS